MRQRKSIKNISAKNNFTPTNSTPDSRQDKTIQLNTSLAQQHYKNV